MTNNKEKVNTIILDIEGTLTNPRGDAGKCNYELRNKLNELEEGGRLLILCSGRDIAYINNLKTEWGLSTSSQVIAENGCLVFDGFKEYVTYNTSTFAPRSIRERILSINILEFAEFDLAKKYMVTLYPKGFSAGAMVSQGQILKIFESTKPQLSDLELNITYSSASVDIMPKGVNKLFGLKNLVTLLGSTPLDLGQAMYIGDSMNDLEIGKYLRASGGLFCVPQNALTELKRTANYIAERVCDEGVLEIFEKFEI